MYLYKRAKTRRHSKHIDSLKACTILSTRNTNEKCLKSKQIPNITQTFRKYLFYTIMGFWGVVFLNIQ